MREVERMTITLTSELTHAIRSAIEGGDYASNSEIVREALRDWKHKRMIQDTKGKNRSPRR